MNVDVNLFDKRSVKTALAELEKMQKILENKDLILKRIAEVGLDIAKLGFEGGSGLADPNYFGADLVVSLEQIENGFQIQANGEKVCYIEFGAGVAYNAGYPYPGERPAEIDDIGMHNTKEPGRPSKGMHQRWKYPPEGKTTSGIMARSPMYFALQEMQRQAPKIINEVISKK